MVVAGPGTGKTELLSVRAANILNKTDVLPENILCLTFTESGQAAMRERLVGIIGKDAYRVAIHTFHSFGSEIINHNREYFYNNALFEPADELKQYEILRGIFEGLHFSNPLASMMNGEYTHLSDAKRVISELKRTSALTSDELLAVIEQSETSLDILENIIAPILEERVSKATADKLRDVMPRVQDHAKTVEMMYEVPPLAKIIADSLQTMLDEADSVHPTKPISAWKSSWLERDEAKNLRFKDRRNLTKLKALSFIYYEYLSQMEKAGLFDYDDMVMQVVHAVEVHDDLKYNLQEKYLYIMVDEFQDTNLAQLRILHSLTDNPVNEGRPNILVVGDDDQAIYGFQGADISNILNFSSVYPARELIVLTDNYRSGESILTVSRAVITQGADRLETRISELNKRLAAKKPLAGEVTLCQTSTIDAERSEIVRRVKEDLEKGTSPSEIAVLSRRHADIQSLLPFFRQAGIQVRYEKEESVLDTKPVLALEQLARIVLALAEGRHSDVEGLLPEMLAHPAWKLDPKVIWRLSLDAYSARKNWMEIMAITPELVNIHAWLVDLAKQSATTALEPMIDLLIGRSDDDKTSPYYDYFFSSEKLGHNPEAYLEYLSALRAIRARLREHQPKRSLDLKDFINFVDLHKRLNITISAKSFSLASDSAAVQLLTVHKSKGLEFDSVYVFNSVDSVWGQTARTGSSSIAYPKNLPLAPAGNTADERLRLYYVAMTRARNKLTLTYSQANDSTKSTLVADFLIPTNIAFEEAVNDSITESVKTAELSWFEPLVETSAELKQALRPQIETFKLSATSLNSFLDVTRGGPQHFLLNNLLRFPQAKAASASYGTAIHWTMHQLHVHMLATGEPKPLEDSLQDFEAALKKERLSDADFQRYLQQGSEHLPIFLNSNEAPITKSQKSEVTFKHQDVRLGDARLTGALDVVDINKDDKTIVVTDYKTGHPATAWGKGTPFEKLKLHNYHQQLNFYKILVENSSEFNNYQVVEGRLAFIEPTKSGESVVLPLNLGSRNEDVERTEKLIAAVWRHIIELNFPDTNSYSQDLSGVEAFEQDLIDEIV